jgi:hypothetical protein
MPKYLPSFFITFLHTGKKTGTPGYLSESGIPFMRRVKKRIVIALILITQAFHHSTLSVRNHFCFSTIKNKQAIPRKFQFYWLGVPAFIQKYAAFKPAAIYFFLDKSFVILLRKNIKSMITPIIKNMPMIPCTMIGNVLIKAVTFIINYLLNHWADQA